LDPRGDVNFRQDFGIRFGVNQDLQAVCNGPRQESESSFTEHLNDKTTDADLASDTIGVSGTTPSFRF